MKKYLIMLIVLLVMPFISLGSKAEADTSKNSSRVGITFVDDRDMDNEVINNKDRLPSTGSKIKSNLILLGILLILLSLCIDHKVKNEKSRIK